MCCYRITKDVSPRACEHEFMDMTKSFFECFVHVNKMLGRYIDMEDKIFVDVEEYSTMCPWMNDLYG